MTTFAPIYYLNQALKFAGFTNTYNGSSWTVNGTAASQTGGLNSITVSNETSGTGAVTSPAVSLTGAAISLSTTLTDSSGNPLPNTAVTFNVSEYGTLPATGFLLPTVENANGTVVSNTKGTNAYQYVVYTDSTGKANISMTGPAGNTFSYEVVATAPYAGTSGNAVSSQPAYVEFVANNTAGISPYASSASSAYSAAIGSSVPITVTLPPNSSGQAQANVSLTLTILDSTGLSPGTSGYSAHAAFVTSTGGVQGSQINVVTNSAGIAQAYLSDAYVEKVQVEVAGLPAGVNAPTNNTWISFAQTGIPANFNNFSISSTSPNLGQDVYVSGQLTDAAGNPVPNGQILVTAPNASFTSATIPGGGTVGGTNGGSNDFSYISGTTTTAFPVLGANYASLTQGTPATGGYGDLVTADSNGNFSFGLTNPQQETQDYAIYPVSNGQVQGGTLPIPSGDNEIGFGTSDTLATLSVGGFDSYVQSNSSTSLTGLSAQINGGAITEGALGAPGANGNYDNGTNPQIADVYVEPQNSAGKVANGGVLNSVNETYNLSVNNGGQIYSINGTPINPAAGISLQYNASTGNFEVNGNSLAPISLLKTSVSGKELTVPTAQVSDFEVGVINSNGGATTLTISSGSVSSTAAVNFVGGTPAYVASFSPSYVDLNPGQQQTVTYTIEDGNGNPVPNATMTISSPDTNNPNPLWLTQVNNVTLAQNETIGSGTNSGSEPTPIPLSGSLPGGATSYNSVVLPGVVAWNGGSDISVYGNSSGQVSLTFQSDGVYYYLNKISAPAQLLGAVTTLPSGATVTESVYTYDKAGDGGSPQLFIDGTLPTPPNGKPLVTISEITSN
jgi:protocatechuate 3,4-dioxygenase beta subunit